jgi:hypothetical protein
MGTLFPNTEAMAGRWRQQQRGSGNSGSSGCRATEAEWQQCGSGSIADAAVAVAAVTQQAASRGPQGGRTLAAEAAAEQWQWRQHGNGSVCTRAAAAAQRRRQSSREAGAAQRQQGNVGGRAAAAEQRQRGRAAEPVRQR